MSAMKNRITCAVVVLPLALILSSCPRNTFTVRIVNDAQDAAVIAL